MILFCDNEELGKIVLWGGGSSVCGMLEEDYDGIEILIVWSDDEYRFEMSSQKRRTKIWRILLVGKSIFWLNRGTLGRLYVLFLLVFYSKIYFQIFLILQLVCDILFCCVGS